MCRFLYIAGGFFRGCDVPWHIQPSACGKFMSPSVEVLHGASVGRDTPLGPERYPEEPVVLLQQAAHPYLADFKGPVDKSFGVPFVDVEFRECLPVEYHVCHTVSGNLHVMVQQPAEQPDPVRAVVVHHGILRIGVEQPGYETVYLRLLVRIYVLQALFCASAQQYSGAGEHYGNPIHFLLS